MRAITAVITAAISGGTLAIVYVSIEITAAAAGSALPDAVRTWAATMIALTTLGPLGMAILCRQAVIITDLAENRAILTEIRDILVARASDDQAERDFNDIQRRLNGRRGADGITHIYPEE